MLPLCCCYAAATFTLPSAVIAAATAVAVAAATAVASPDTIVSTLKNDAAVAVVTVGVVAVLLRRLFPHKQ